MKLDSFYLRESQLNIHHWHDLPMAICELSHNVDRYKSIFNKISRTIE